MRAQARTMVVTTTSDYGHDALLDRGRGHDHREQQAVHVGGDVPLATVDLRAGVDTLTVFVDIAGSLHALRVSGSGRASGGEANAIPQHIVRDLPQVVHPCRDSRPAPGVERSQLINPGAIAKPDRPPQTKIRRPLPGGGMDLERHCAEMVRQTELLGSGGVVRSAGPSPESAVGRFPRLEPFRQDTSGRTGVRLERHPVDDPAVFTGGGHRRNGGGAENRRSSSHPTPVGSSR